MHDRERAAFELARLDEPRCRPQPLHRSRPSRTRPASAALAGTPASQKIASARKADRRFEWPDSTAPVTPDNRRRPYRQRRTTGSRAYRLTAAGPLGKTAPDLNCFNDRCDMVVATAVLKDRRAECGELKVVEFLDGKTVMDWAAVSARVVMLTKSAVGPLPDFSPSRCTRPLLHGGGELDHSALLGHSPGAFAPLSVGHLSLDFSPCRGASGRSERAITVRERSVTVQDFRCRARPFSDRRGYAFQLGRRRPPSLDSGTASGSRRQ